MTNTRSRVAVLTAAVAAALMIINPAAQAGTADQQVAPVAAAADALADAKAGVKKLEAYESQVRSMPPVGKAHDYRSSVMPAFWSVFAVWSPTDGDMDLELFADKAHKHSLGGSAFGTGMVDFIAVDGSLKPGGDYFPQAKAYSGTSAYAIEFAHGVDVLASNPKEFYMMNEDLVRVYDMYMAAGKTYTITLDAVSPYLNGDLFVVGSTPGDPSTGVKRRIDALKTAASQGEGGTETITFTPTVSDTYGVVVVNAAGSGAFTLARTFS
jgi:hypothetical protein